MLHIDNADTQDQVLLKAAKHFSKKEKEKESSQASSIKSIRIRVQTCNLRMSCFKCDSTATERLFLLSLVDQRTIYR